MDKGFIKSVYKCKCDGGFNSLVQSAPHQQLQRCRITLPLAMLLQPLMQGALNGLNMVLSFQRTINRSLDSKPNFLRRYKTFMHFSTKFMDNGTKQYIEIKCINQPIERKKRKKEKKSKQKEKNTRPHKLACLLESLVMPFMK